MSEFNGLVALVTGGANGIGAATSALLHQRGARVAILDRDPEGTLPHALAVRCDVAESSAVDEAVAAVAGHFGALDVVINNAGIGATGSVSDNADDEWRRVLDVNVIGVARVTRAALPHLRRSPRRRSRTRSSP